MPASAAPLSKKKIGKNNTGGAFAPLLHHLPPASPVILATRTVHIQNKICRLKSVIRRS